MRITNQQTKYEFGDTINIVCEIGYTLQGNHELTCLADKTWDSTVPSCISMYISH